MTGLTPGSHDLLTAATPAVTGPDFFLFDPANNVIIFTPAGYTATAGPVMVS